MGTSILEYIPCGGVLLGTWLVWRLGCVITGRFCNLRLLARLLRRPLVGFGWVWWPFLGLWRPIPPGSGSFLWFGGSSVFLTGFLLLIVALGCSSRGRGCQSFLLSSLGRISLRQSWILWSCRGFLLRSGVRTRHPLFRCIRCGR